MPAKTRTSRWSLLDPMVAAAPEPVARAPRPSSLAGKRVGLLENSKLNASRLLDLIEEMLRERYGIGDALRASKLRPSRIAPKDVLDELARSCDVVVTAIGD